MDDKSKKGNNVVHLGGMPSDFSDEFLKLCERHDVNTYAASFYIGDEIKHVHFKDDSVSALELIGLLDYFKSYLKKYYFEEE